MKKYFLAVAVLLAAACTKSDDDAKLVIPPHNASECPTISSFVGATQKTVRFQSIPSGMKVIDSDGDETIIDGQTHFDGETSYAGGCQNGGLQVNGVKGKDWVNMTIRKSGLGYEFSIDGSRGKKGPYYRDQNGR